MIHWAFLLPALFVGIFLGGVAIGLLTAGAAESSYQYGFCEGFADGHAAGFNDGLKEIQKVG